MIKSWAYDVEILPNFFSVTFVDVNDYIDKFTDACLISIKKGKEVKTPIPLTEKYSVKEIKEKLDNIIHYSFYITDKNDSQLFELLKFVNELRPKITAKNEAVRNDLFGFNSSNYDKLMMAAFLMYHNRVNNTKELIHQLYITSKSIIESQKNFSFKKDYYLKLLSDYNLPYIDIDIMTIFALNKVTKGTNEKGETVWYPKSLKQTSINLKWYELLEYEMPDIREEDEPLYHKWFPEHKGFSYVALNARIEKWDRVMLEHNINDMMKYNLNDVFIVCEIIRLFSEEILLRYKISNNYKINVLSSSRSNIADRLFTKFYSEFSGLPYHIWGGQKTERNNIHFKDVVFDNVYFKTKELQNLLKEIKKIYFTNILDTVKENRFNKTIKFRNVIYQLGIGGLHSKDLPRNLKSKLDVCHSPRTGRCADKLSEFLQDKEDTKEFSSNKYDKIYVNETLIDKTDDSYLYFHYDVSSYYPSLISSYNIAPEHLDRVTFVKLVTWLKDTRITAKHSKEEFIDGIHKSILAEVLKIVINSIYGKLRFKNGELYDELAALQVTVNGQLYLLMLTEWFELAGIPVISANTDGIVVKVYKNKYNNFVNIYKEWQEYTKLDGDTEEYESYINRDVNTYIAKETNGKLTYKGDMNPKSYLVNLNKGYNMPIVAHAVSEYFINRIPILDTLYKATDILDFCKTQNVGKKFHIEFTKGSENTKLQRYVRYYVSTNGGNIEKVSELTRSGLAAGFKVNILNTLDDTSINKRNIDYNYYYNECIKLIDPIELGISPNQKANSATGSKSGKNLLKKYSGCYESLFNDEDFK